MDILRLRPIIRHVRVILRCDNYRQGKFGKFIKSKFKILTCVVLLGRLNTMRGISAGKYDKGNKSIMMRGIWVGEIYIAINYISIVSASHYPVTVKTTTNFSNICYLLLKSFLIRFLYIFVLWEVSTGDAVMTRLFFQSLCHAFSYLAALMIWQQAGKKHSIVFKSLPIQSKITL